MQKAYTINPSKAISEILEGETIIIHLETGCYYSLNHDGSIIWEAILNQKNLVANSPEIISFIEFLTTENLIQETAPTSESFELINLNPKIEKYTDLQEMLLADPVHDVDDAGWPNLKKEA